MARSVVWTEPAWDDLEAGAEYIARDSEHYAAAFVREVRDAAESLSEFAERGQVVPEFDDATLRELLIGAHRQIYQVSKPQVLMLGLIHGATRFRRY